MTVPTVLIGFNRPNLTTRMVDALRTVRPERLFLICDGPRPGHAGDVDRTAAVRAALDAIDWPAEVTRRYSEVNLGCEASVELGLDAVFAEVDRAVILEDDCLPDPSFFRYCEQLLDRYAAEPKVWHIAGNRHEVPAARFDGDTYAFSTWASVWGWATWSDRWQQHRGQFPRTHVGPDGAAPRRTIPAQPRAGALVTRAGARHFAEAASSSDVVTHGWDKHWWLTIASQGGLSVTPTVNLVENVGFGADATHGTSERRLESASAVTFPLQHPAQITLNREVERDLELVLTRVGGRVARTARRMIRSPRLRRSARLAVNSRVVTVAMRAASKRR